MVFAQIFASMQNGKSFNLCELRKHQAVETKVINCRNEIHKVTTNNGVDVVRGHSFEARGRYAKTTEGSRWERGL